MSEEFEITQIHADELQDVLRKQPTQDFDRLMYKVLCARRAHERIVRSHRAEPAVAAALYNELYDAQSALDDLMEEISAVLETDEEDLLAFRQVLQPTQGETNEHENTQAPVPSAPSGADT